MMCSLVYLERQFAVYLKTAEKAVLRPTPLGVDMNEAKSMR